MACFTKDPVSFLSWLAKLSPDRERAIRVSCLSWSLALREDGIDVVDSQVVDEPFFLEQLLRIVRLLPRGVLRKLVDAITQELSQRDQGESETS